MATRKNFIENGGVLILWGQIHIHMGLFFLNMRLVGVVRMRLVRVGRLGLRL